MIRVELWQAVALLLDMEPEVDNQVLEEEPFEPSNRRIPFPAIFWDALMIVRNNLGPAGPGRMGPDSTSRDSHRAVVDLRVVRDFAVSIGWTVPSRFPCSEGGTFDGSVDAPPPVTVPPDERTVASRPNWQVLARDAAIRIIERDRSRGHYPNQGLIADEIAKDFHRRGIVGPDGKPLTSATIKRHALKGIQSGESVPRSTRSKQGK